MKNCPKCNSSVDDNFDVCWNCQYSFNDDRILEDSNFSEVCPKCNASIESESQSCSNCGYDFRTIKYDFEKSPQSDKSSEIQTDYFKKFDCLRCKIPMDYKGNYRFHEGLRFGVLGNFFELFVNKESFDLYICPTCGKIEFFLPD